MRSQAHGTIFVLIPNRSNSASAARATDLSEGLRERSDIGRQKDAGFEMIDDVAINIPSGLRRPGAYREFLGRKVYGIDRSL